MALTTQWLSNKQEGKMVKLVVKKKAAPAKKAAVKKAVARTTRKGTIADLVRSTLGKNVNYSYEKLRAQVKKLNPRSKFDESQFAWYKSKIANGKLKGLKR